MAVFNPNTASLTPAYRNIQQILQQRAELEQSRQSPLSMASNALDVVGSTLAEKRKRRAAIEERQSEQAFQLSKIQAEQDYETRRTIFQEELRRQTQEAKDARDAKEDAKQRAHERRGEVSVTAEKRAQLEQELGLDEGMLGELDGLSMKQDDLDKVIQNAFKRVVAQVKSEPAKDTEVANFGGKSVKYKDTKQFSTQPQRLRGALVQASSKDAIDDISKAEFAGAGAGGIKMSPADIKGGIMISMMQNGYDSLSPEQKMIIDSEVNKDPAMDKALRLYAQGGMGFGKKPGEAYQEVTALANQMRSDAVSRANSDEVANTMTSKQRNVFQQNVDGAIDAIRNQEDSYENIMASLQATNPTFFDALKKEIDAKLNKRT